MIDESGNDENRTVSNSEFLCCDLEFLRPIFNSCAQTNREGHGNSDTMK